MSVTVRRDIFAVKVFDKHHGFWCFEAMFYTSADAMRWMKDQKYCDPFVMAKLVHPRQWVVDGFVLAGNHIA
jgi:hypothetical protein